VNVIPHDRGSDLDPRASIDALNLWFDRQQKQWWKTWRWVAYVAVLVTAVDVIHSVRSGAGMYVVLNASNSTWAQRWLAAGIQGHFSDILMWFAWLVVVVIATANTKALFVLPDLSAAFSDADLYSTLHYRVRSVSYKWMSLFIGPWLILYVYSFTLFGRFDVMSELLAAYAAMSFLLLAEAIAFLRLRNVASLQSCVGLVLLLIVLLHYGLNTFVYWFDLYAGWQPSSLNYVVVSLPLLVVTFATIFLANHSVRIDSRALEQPA
jgi:hypothetical protein